MSNVNRTFAERRLAQMVEDNDLPAASEFIVLLCTKDYHEKSTTEMMDLLEDLKYRVDRILCTSP